MQFTCISPEMSATVNSKDSRLHRVFR